MSDNHKVFIVDDDAAVRDSLNMLLEAAGYSVLTFPSASDFLNAYSPDTAGCIILDVNMPDMDGPALQKEVTRRGLYLPIIFLSGQGTIPITVRAIQAGAMNFLTKPVNGSVLLALVEEALEQSCRLRQQAEVKESIEKKMAKLSERERKVMMLAIDGHSSKEIGIRLFISTRTVELHRAHVIKKMEVTNMIELAQLVKP